MFFWHFVRQKEKGSPKADFFITVFFEVLLCYFATFGHKKKRFFLRNAFIYAKCPVSLWHIVSVRNMQPDTISVSLTNALVKVAHQHDVPLPIQTFLPIATPHIGCKTIQVI